MVQMCIRDSLDGHVTDELAVQTVLDHAGGELVVLALGAGQRGVVGAEGHGDGRIVHMDERQRLRVVGVDDGLADHDVVNAGNGHDVAGACGFDRDTLEALGAQQFGDAEVLEGAVHTGQAVGLAFLKGAVVDTDQTESAEEVGGVDVCLLYTSCTGGCLTAVYGIGRLISCLASCLAAAGRGCRSPIVLVLVCCNGMFSDIQ